MLSLLFDAAGIACLVAFFAARNGGNPQAFPASVPTQVWIPAVVILFGIGTLILGYGVARRNATEMAVTDRRVLIKTGMASRRTLDLMLTKVESIGVEETVWGRMLGYGSVLVHGTGGTPEVFELIGHPQEFRRAVQEQIGTK